MIQALLFIRFKNQLRRTKPELINSLDSAFYTASAAAGGVIEQKHTIISVAFNEQRIGFLLDMLIFLEEMKTHIEKSGKDLLGHAIILGSELQNERLDKICRFYSGVNVHQHTGVWCSPNMAKALEPYGIFAPPNKGFSELKDIFTNPDTPKVSFPYREKIAGVLMDAKDENILLAGPPRIGKRDGVYHFCKLITGDIPPLVIRFRKGNPACFVVALNQKIRSFLVQAPEYTAENEDLNKNLLDLDYLGGLLSKERLRTEIPAVLMETAQNFLRLLLDTYANAVRRVKLASGTLNHELGRIFAIVILEGVVKTNGCSAQLFREVYNEPGRKNKLFVIGTGMLTENIKSSENGNSSEIQPMDEFKEWKGVFTRVLKLPTVDFYNSNNIEIPLCLLEISYTMVLLNRYFSVSDFSVLFAEEELNPQLPEKALNMLKIFGLIDAVDDPRPRIPDFLAYAEHLLSTQAYDSTLKLKKEEIFNMVYRRLTSWIDSGKINPCFALLNILKNLGKNADDSLVLRIIREEIYNGSYFKDEDYLESDSFFRNASTTNRYSLIWIYKTLGTLVWGSKKELLKLFEESNQNELILMSRNRDLYLGFRLQILINLGAYRLGIGDQTGAEKVLKEAMLENQYLGDKAISAYRLFSLVNLLKNRLNESMEYIVFAVEQTGKNNTGEAYKKNDEYTEQLKSLYFAAVIYFLYGNLTKAEEFALGAEKAAIKFNMNDLSNKEYFANIAVGQAADWMAKARFLRGRIRFEAGEYQEAHEIFSSIVSNRAVDSTSVFPSLFASESGERDKTLAAWIYRSRIFTDFHKNGGRLSILPDTPALLNSDGLIFSAEAAFMAGDYNETLAITETYLNNYRSSLNNDKEFFFTEQPDWRSGYSQCENIIIPSGETLNRLARIYRTLAKCSLGVTEHEHGELINQGQEFFRNELLPDGDPGDTFYYYAQYSILKKNSVSRIDMGTLVSMAFKRLQRRAGRIDDVKLRQSYIFKNHWNSILSHVAKEYRLIH